MLVALKRILSSIPLTSPLARVKFFKANARTPFAKAHFLLQIIYDDLFSGLRCTYSRQERLYLWTDLQKCLCFLVCGWFPVTSNLTVPFNRIDAGRIFVRKVVTHYTLWYELALHRATCLQPTPNIII